MHRGMAELHHRAREILCAVVTEFIASGEPVGSRTLAKKYGLDLSAATIRNVLSDLEDGGYLLQPHTSAGRVPSEKALRFFVDALMRLRPPSSEENSTIAERFHDLSPGPDMMRQTGRLLSELTGAAAVVRAPKPETRALCQLRFIPTRPGEILAVIVFADGTVENRFVSIDRPLLEPELTRIHNLLSDVIEGRSLGEVRDLFLRRLQDDRLQFDSLRHRAFELGFQAVEGGIEVGVVIEGQARLLEHPEFSDAERMKGLVLALAERETLVSLLDRTIEARGLKVFLGSEVGGLAAGKVSVVAAPYTEQGRVAGTIGVVGPTRMDYPKVVPLVEATASAMSDALDRAHGEGPKA